MNSPSEPQNESRDVQTRWFWYFMNAEAFLIGSLLFGLFVVTFSVWVAESWSKGEQALVMTSTLGALAVIGVFIYATKRKQRILSFAAALTVLGAMIYMLASLGVFA